LSNAKSTDFHSFACIDDDEKWTVYEIGSHFELFTVIVHEIGMFWAQFGFLTLKEKYIINHF
jgi:hypothetical protein